MTLFFPQRANRILQRPGLASLPQAVQCGGTRKDIRPDLGLTPLWGTVGALQIYGIVTMVAAFFLLARGWALGPTIHLNGTPSCETPLLS